MIIPDSIFIRVIENCELISFVFIIFLNKFQNQIIVMKIEGHVFPEKKGVNLEKCRNLQYSCKL